MGETSGWNGVFECLRAEGRVVAGCAFQSLQMGLGNMIPGLCTTPGSRSVFPRAAEDAFPSAFWPFDGLRDERRVIRQRVQVKQQEHLSTLYCRQ